MGLEVHHDGVEPTNSLEWQSAVVSQWPCNSNLFYVILCISFNLANKVRAIIVECHRGHDPNVEIMRFALKPHDSYHNITQQCAAVTWTHKFIWMISKVCSKLTVLICALGLTLQLGRLPLVSGQNLITKLITLFNQPHGNPRKIVIFVCCYS